MQHSSEFSDSPELLTGITLSEFGAYHTHPHGRRITGRPPLRSNSVKFRFFPPTEGGAQCPAEWPSARRIASSEAAGRPQVHKQTAGDIAKNSVTRASLIFRFEQFDSAHAAAGRRPDFTSRERAPLLWLRLHYTCAFRFISRSRCIDYKTRRKAPGNWPLTLPPPPTPRSISLAPCPSFFIIFSRVLLFSFF